MTILAEWGTFYQVLGSASAALTGLQFVTMALLADIPLRDPNETDASDAFATPTIVHFMSALLLAALGAAPWHRLGPAAVCWGFVGGAGLVYTLWVVRLMRAQEVYEPVFEDWAFHAVLPVVAYALLVISAVMVRGDAMFAVVSVACSALLLLVTGVHNAWDNLTFLALRKRKQARG